MNLRFSLITHENGTASLVENSSGQAMHSRIGPWQEAKVLYVDPSGLSERLNGPREMGPVVLHDVGMGIAANVLAAIDSFHKMEAGLVVRMLEIHSFENDLTGLTTALSRSDAFPFLAESEALLRELLEKKKVQRKNLVWNLHEGDYFKNLERTSAPEIIYYDFYAPQVYPQLWTPQCFQKIHQSLESRLKQGLSTELYTYSASTAVRAALLNAGFFVGFGASTELKLETTIASTRLSKLKKPLAPAWLQKLGRSKPSAAHFSEDDWKTLQQNLLAHPQWKS